MVSNTSFRRFVIVDVLDTFSIGFAAVVLPLLISQRLGSGNELVITTALLTLPSVFLPPTVGYILLKRKLSTLGRMAGIVFVIFLGLPFVAHYRILQGCILIRCIVGILSSASSFRAEPGLLLREQTIAPSPILVMLGRMFRFVTPTIAGIAVWVFSIEGCFYLTLCLVLLDVILIITGGLPAHLMETHMLRPLNVPSYGAFFRIFRKRVIVIMLFIPLIAYEILFGSLRLFLLWSTMELFHRAPISYTSLLAVHGFGIFLGSLLAEILFPRLGANISVMKLYLSMRIAGVLGFCSLAWLSDFALCRWILLINGIPNSLASACLFNLLKKYLSNQEQGIVHSLSFAIAQFCRFCGILLCVIYTQSYLGLHSFWVMLCIIALVLNLFSWWLLKRSGNLDLRWE